MRIGIVSPEFPPGIGGVESYAHGYSRELISKGYEVTVFTTADSDPSVLPDATLIADLKVSLEHDRGTLLAHNVDAWHVMNAAYAWLAECNSKPTIVSVHGNDFLRPYLRVCRPTIPEWTRYWRTDNLLMNVRNALGGLLTKAKLVSALPAATRVIANSRYTEQVLLKMIPACADNTTVAYVGIDETWLTPPLRQRIQSNETRLLTVARLSEPRKNIGAVLRALSKLRDRYSFSYTIVGDGSMRPELEQLSEMLGLSDRVIFRGFLSQEELRAAFTEADLFILTSSILADSHEGFGIVYLEANACGTPVLAARKAGAIEAVDEGLSGYFVEDTTPAAIRFSLQRFLNEDIKFEPDKCRAFARRFNWGNVVKRVTPYYTLDQ